LALDISKSHIPFRCIIVNLQVLIPFDYVIHRDTSIASWNGIAVVECSRFTR
jgi:hypothetical protein